MFRILGIKILKGCFPSVHKILKEGNLYLLFDDVTEDIEEENNLKLSDNGQSKECDPYNLALYNDGKIQVCVGAIVGKNGDGKSTFVEIVLRILNNFAYSYGFRNDQESLHYNIGVAGILYFEVDAHVYAIRCEGGEEAFIKGGIPNIRCYEDGTLISDVNLEDNDLRKKYVLKEKRLEQLFYTMVINYSLYAYNPLQMLHETKDRSSWIDELFHKNDSYQTPVVLNPMRTEGNIDINREEQLSYQRLLSLYTLSGGDELGRRIGDNDSHKIAFGLAFYLEDESKFITETLENYFSNHHKDDYKWDNVDAFFAPRIKLDDDIYQGQDNLCMRFLEFWKEFDGIYKENRLLIKEAKRILGSDGYGRSGKSDLNKYISTLFGHLQLIRPDEVKPYEKSIHDFLDSESEVMNYAEFYQLVKIMVVWNMLNKECKEINCSLNEAIEHRKEPLYAAKLYILYKIIEIMNTYKPYKDNSYFEDTTYQTLVNPIMKSIGFNKMETDIKLILSKDDYTTLKLRQTLNYIKNYTAENAYYQGVDIKEAIPEYEVRTGETHFVAFEHLKNQLEVANGYTGPSSIMTLLPPPIFKGSIILKVDDVSLNKVSYVSMETMSSGERQMLNSIGSFNYHLRNLDAVLTDDNKIQYINIFVVFEEVELYFHPAYQKSYINWLMRQIKQSNLQHIKRIFLLFVTHSPFILSDIIKNNILYLKDGENANNQMKVNTFASNINELLSESFFLNRGFAGEYAKAVINDLVHYLLSDDKNEHGWDMTSADNLIKLVGDEVVKIQLRKLFIHKFGRESEYLDWLTNEYQKKVLKKEN